ncbi:hypothetical protein PENTCL1PPCAC_9048, partial [Pristionchus entomophagus]
QDKAHFHKCHLLQMWTNADGSTYTCKQDIPEPPSVHVYRICDDPEQGGIILDVNGLNDWMPLCVHRGKIIVSTRNERLLTPIVAKLSENVLHVQGLHPHGGSICARDSSPFVYIIDGELLRVLDTRTVEILPALACEW